MTDIQSIAAKSAHLPVDQRILLTRGLEDSIGPWPGEEPAELPTTPEFQSLLSEGVALTIDERFELISAIWESIPDEQRPPLSDEWLAEIERRSAEYDAGNARTYTWEEVQEAALRHAGIVSPLDASQPNRPKWPPLLVEFIKAAVNDLPKARALFRDHPEVLELRTGIGETALHYLSVENYAAAVQLLIDLGASVNVTNDFGASPLQEAVRVDAFEAAKVLRSAGAH